MKLLDLFEKFRDETPEVGGVKALPQPFLRSYDHPIFPSIEHFMNQHGWTRLSSGLWADVFESTKNPHQVLKIIKGGDPGWTRFYSLAKRSDNPHFPEVSRLGIMKIPDFRSGTLGRDDVRPDIRVIACLVEKLTRVPGYMLGKSGDIDDEVDHQAKMLSKQFTDYITDNTPLGERIESTWPELRAALDLVRGLTKHYLLDLHEYNFMWRYNTPVITDPVQP